MDLGTRAGMRGGHDADELERERGVEVSQGGTARGVLWEQGGGSGEQKTKVDESKKRGVDIKNRVLSDKYR